MSDTVLFMSAYQATHFIAKNRFFSKLYLPKSRKHNVQSLLKKHHLTYIAANNRVITADGKFNMEMEYDYVRQLSHFTFHSAESESPAPPKTNEVKYYLNLKHAQEVVLDTKYFDINLSFGLEPFLVGINEIIYQVDSFAFMMNNVLFIIFEIIDYKSGQLLTKELVNAKSKNFNLIKTEHFQFFDSNDSIPSNSEISVLIYKQIFNFLSEVTHKNYTVESYTYVYDTVIFSNTITDLDDFISKYMCVTKPVSIRNNISTVELYDYYPQEGFSVIIEKDADSFNSSLFTIILLEALKLFIYIFQTSNLEDTIDIYGTIQNDIYLHDLFCSPHLPIETLNLLSFIRESKPFIDHEEAIKLKISFLTLKNDLKKNRNATILSILLYIISLLGIISNLDTIESHFGIPFKYSFITVIILLLLGLVCFIKEYHNNKKL